MGTSLEDKQMGNHEISFNTNLSEPSGTRADFTLQNLPQGDFHFRYKLWALAL